MTNWCRQIRQKRDLVSLLCTLVSLLCTLVSLLCTLDSLLCTLVSLLCTLVGEGAALHLLLEGITTCYHVSENSFGGLYPPGHRDLREAWRRRQQPLRYVR